MTFRNFGVNFGVIELERHSGCKNCDLHFTCKSVGIPTRYFGDGDPGGFDRALLVVGEAPGFNEDQDGCCWVGQAGQLLRKLYIRDVFGFHKKMDVWVGNVVRCRPPENDTPTEAQRRACLPYLKADVDYLQARYREVWILCCGAVAAWAFGFKSLSSAFKAQGLEGGLVSINIEKKGKRKHE